MARAAERAQAVLIPAGKVVGQTVEACAHARVAMETLAHFAEGPGEVAPRFEPLTARWSAAAVLPMLLACSGPCVQFLMMHAHWFGWLTFALALAMAVVLATRAVEDRRFGKLVGGCIAVALHPGWWLSAYDGDCGSSRILAGGIATVALLVVGVSAGWFRLFERLHPAARAAATGGVVLLLVAATLVAPMGMRLFDRENQDCLEAAGRDPILGRRR